MNQKLQSQKIFSTTDLALCSALLCLGFRLKEIDKSAPRAFFLFERTIELERDSAMFWAGDLQVDPKRYFACLKEIKSRLYGN